MKMIKQDSFDIAETVKIENEEFNKINQRQLLRVTDILDEEIEQGVDSKRELKVIAYRELLKLSDSY